MTSPSPSRLPLAAAAALALLLSGCGGMPRMPKLPKIPNPLAGRGDPAETGDAITLLNRGRAEEARRVLRDVLERTPNDPVARSLLRQIDTDPKVLLGAQSTLYKVKPGETLSELAQRFLGDPTLFYALARYNGIAAPEELQPGRALMIPTRGRTAAPRPVERSRPTAPAPAPAAPAIAAPAPKPPPNPAADPVGASRLRAAGLEAMNRGAIDRAVALLRQARVRDPGSALIQRDLARAVKLQAAVRAR